MSSTSSFLFMRDTWKYLHHTEWQKFIWNTWNEWLRLAPVWSTSRAGDSSTCAKIFFLKQDIFGFKAAAAQSLTLTLSNQFPRLDRENKHPLLSASAIGALGRQHHTGTAWSKHDATQANVRGGHQAERAKAELQTSQLPDQKDICQSLLFSRHKDGKLWELGSCQVEDSSPNLIVAITWKNPFTLLKKPS